MTHLPTRRPDHHVDCGPSLRNQDHQPTHLLHHPAKPLTPSRRPRVRPGPREFICAGQAARGTRANRDEPPRTAPNGGRNGGQESPSGQRRCVRRTAELPAAERDGGGEGQAATSPASARSWRRFVVVRGLGGQHQCAGAAPRRHRLDALTLTDRTPTADDRRRVGRRRPAARPHLLLPAGAARRGRGRRGRRPGSAGQLSSTDMMLPPGSVNQAIAGPCGPRAMPLSSWSKLS